MNYCSNTMMILVTVSRVRLVKYFFLLCHTAIEKHHTYVKIYMANSTALPEKTKK